MLLTFAIDTKEGRYLAVTYIPGAFLHANLEQADHMLFTGQLLR